MVEWAVVEWRFIGYYQRSAELCVFGDNLPLSPKGLYLSGL